MGPRRGDAEHPPKRRWESTHSPPRSKRDIGSCVGRVIAKQLFAALSGEPQGMRAHGRTKPAVRESARPSDRQTAQDEGVHDNETKER